MVLSEAYLVQLRITLKEGPLSSMVQDTKLHNCRVLFLSTIKKELQSNKYRAVDQMTWWDKFFQLELTDVTDTPHGETRSLLCFVAKLQGLARSRITPWSMLP